MNIDSLTIGEARQLAQMYPNVPKAPPGKSAKTKRIIRDRVEKVIYYEDATFELLGTPIAYFRSCPGPTPPRSGRPAFWSPS